MPSSEIDLLLENQNLKNEFCIRNLDLLQVWQPTSDNPELENRQLRYLLEWVDKYRDCPDREKMETDGYQFPPISFDIEPDNDWYRFERWMRGLPVRKTLRNQLTPHLKIKPSEAISETEITAALAELTDACQQIHYDISLSGSPPARLVYEYLLEKLDVEHEMLGESVWCYDGCSGYCPGCFQRPWCESGCDGCWSEDEKAGCMVFPESVKRFVSASPVSLAILQERQAEEDRLMAKIKAEGDKEIKLDPLPELGEEDNRDEEGLPF